MIIKLNDPQPFSSAGMVASFSKRINYPLEKSTNSIKKIRKKLKTWGGPFSALPAWVRKWESVADLRGGNEELKQEIENLTK
jgi:hypothetical protein